MQHDEATEGVDWHRDGADLPRWVLAALLALMACPVLLVGLLIFGVL